MKLFEIRAYGRAVQVVHGETPEAALNQFFADKRYANPRFRADSGRYGLRELLESEVAQHRWEAVAGTRYGTNLAGVEGKFEEWRKFARAIGLNPEDPAIVRLASVGSRTEVIVRGDLATAVCAPARYFPEALTGFH